MANLVQRAAGFGSFIILSYLMSRRSIKRSFYLQAFAHVLCAEICKTCTL